jgi:hypothetical protein
MGLLVLLGALIGAPSLNAHAAADQLPPLPGVVPYDPERYPSLDEYRAQPTHAASLTRPVVASPVSNTTSTPLRAPQEPPPPSPPPSADRTVSLIGALSAAAVMLIGGLTFRWFVNRDRRHQVTPATPERDRGGE